MFAYVVQKILIWKTREFYISDFIRPNSQKIRVYPIRILVMTKRYVESVRTFSIQSAETRFVQINKQRRRLHGKLIFFF
ncbi:hypothetical protein AR158_C703L [Paramecium bursaria Chlorella virus AR158]|uniref:hypothetical protein n=1 Tax=Paramecium bursaria Chlorella virus AR158 TaxID=380598 RepID=UPI00015AA864|nr:hypothetical protein AR158_C703L [Paramecium bursaria Chlorella virus AR158]ABU44248.1 hypothetical protein AR158_C703L [Paramecium bursaria Chlorella virus AR158]